MAKCGWCRATNIPVQDRNGQNSQDGQVLESHSPPWANSTITKCKGHQTWFNGPDARPNQSK